MDAVRTFVLRCLPGPAITTTGILSVAAGEDHVGADRISALPDELLRNISTPLTIYDAHLFPAREPVCVDAIDRVLAGHPGPLRTAHLVYCFFGAHDCDDMLDRWARLLAAGGVEDLVLISQPPPLDMPLPVEILRCSELRRLYLGFWTFPDAAALPDGAGVFPHLQEFVILNTLIDDSVLDHLLASSPALETLALVFCYGLPDRFRPRGQNLQCVLFWLSVAIELAVADAPLLKRLVMWQTRPPSGFDESDGESHMWVRIASTPELKVLGYLDPGVHKLQIGNTVIEADTKASPSSMIPSVKILALKVNLSVFAEVQMLASFLRCFPNIETLHLESSMDDLTTDNHYAEFSEKLSPIECVQSNIKKVVVHGFRGDHLCEAAFLKFITQRVDKLEKLTLVLADKVLGQAGEDLLVALAIPPWASKACTVLLVGCKVERGLNFHQAADLSIEDPFVSEHGQVVRRFTKKE
ncbi:hypothetical protein PR202_gb05650 [Eleusine coracana subsp. coracana]|uniref:FBD domain-containing protein n=1 Tax=Eleusine coracana subsp. coracana TaxID=191504 RepID=A0AAV5E7K9_ELECO|nr:hypothetical protein QOZ80_1BG0073680 [Eleusine coracana subsp. coracana]GJN18484.1 hypothetical protein PR202_gb05650 [Eleusine coracana subsp. coracana]